MTRKITLLGDSIFDNKTYVPDGLCVHEHLLKNIGPADEAYLVAVDGAVVNSVLRQIERIPPETTHLVLSVGGNDALYLQSSVMGQSSENVQDSLAKMKASLRTFQTEYEQVIAALRALNLPLTICTIYDGVPGLDDGSLAGLAIMNDIITRIGFQNALGLIDLRIVCADASDYAAISPIEPSHSGGEKVAAAILRAVTDESPTTRIYC